MCPYFTRVDMVVTHIGFDLDFAHRLSLRVAVIVVAVHTAFMSGLLRGRRAWHERSVWVAAFGSESGVGALYQYVLAKALKLQSSRKYHVVSRCSEKVDSVPTKRMSAIPSHHPRCHCW